MKKFLLILLFVLWSFSANAASQVTFAWDANSESDLAGYEIHKGTVSGTYTGSVDIPLANLSDPASPEYTGSYPDGTFYFALKAYDQSGNYSGFSEEVIVVIDSIAPSIPANFRVIIIVLP